MITVNVDGLAEPNPGLGTYAFIVRDGGRRIKEGYGLAGKMVTNNFAEYEAIVQALSYLLPRAEEQIVVESDSRLLVKQMTGEYRAKKGAYLEKYLQARELAGRFKQISFRWVPREENREADLLTNVAYHRERDREG